MSAEGMDGGYGGLNQKLVWRRLSSASRVLWRAGQTLNSDLLRAIAEKRLVEFVYKTGRTRLAEPHDYGIRHGVERLLVFQLKGHSQSGASHGWKELDVAQIRELRVTEHPFAGTRSESAHRHRDWDTLFARVS
jgi:hypothetical protein